MTPQPLDLIRIALAGKAYNIKHAGEAYVRDRTSRTVGVVTSYVTGITLLIGAGVFALIACLVGAAALFRYIEMRYGLFQAFGATGGALLLVALVLAAIGLAKIKSKPTEVVPLTSRLRVAAHSHPITKQNVKEAAVSFSRGQTQPTNRTIGLAIAGSVLAYLATRRR